MDDQAPRWHVIRTGPGAELIADMQIRQAGFVTFSPAIWKAATPASRDNDGSIRRGRPDRLVALFPRYLMAQFSRADPWRTIWRLRGVDSILSTAPDSPSIVPDSAIAALKARCAPNDCIYPPDHPSLQAQCSRAPLASGTVIRVLTGPMVDLTGICTWSDGRRVRLLLSIMGRAVAVSARQVDVAAV